MTKELSDELRRAIRASDKTVYELSTKSGIPYPTIYRFLAGADMRLSRASKIARVLGLKLTKGK